jgi:hypothetical protein
MDGQVNYDVRRTEPYDGDIGLEIQMIPRLHQHYPTLGLDKSAVSGRLNRLGQAHCLRGGRRPMAHYSEAFSVQTRGEGAMLGETINGDEISR